MNSFLCALTWLAVALLLPVMIIDWATCSKAKRICRLKAMGWSQTRIASHLGVTRYQVRKALSA